MKRLFIKVRGIVQGVGFRPFIFNLAERFNLKGSVKNTSQGVEIDIEGNEVDTFVELLKKESPPLSMIDKIETCQLPIQYFKEFRILESDSTSGFTLISPDISICADCLRELLDSNNRRFQYPFINCTNCGPRYSITQRVPYDRPNTTMAIFKMCNDCLTEYHNPRDRRFHAQPNACPVCGPQLSFKLINTFFPVIDTASPLEQG
ncbi:MAG: acylphosphatase, partial [Thermodesulfovibrionales bacterium]|nr:acylphosphatase [Thermodesulfovibrionales bacterium]